ncbi:hypothetical protein HCAG_08414 [Histoplasma mississippiense (nom. inval.)]|uniref:hypothetical protein n=1 Tax=Ajellomyces capsulatus (strain NAm1 / WU24) TaxID=2059318 RepID=UPI000157D2BF|nr:hypothetical protein HCAG_08414 [Histoplasma mississippiense (nom. inval.)]EDN04752.1 hypothetical protein HCAG_08414 [Histoplasma mississippiense (nom. inval.)]
MKIIDDEHVLREGFHHFEEADISGYDVILGMPWLQAANPDIDWVRRCWTYRKASNISHVHLDTAKEFATLMDNSNIIFAAFPLRAAHAATEPNIPDDYKDYLDVFREDIPDAEHAPHDHAIDLKPGKEPPYRPINNLSPQELSVLREYIEKALEKNWIRPSKSPAEIGFLGFVITTQGITVEKRRVDTILDWPEPRTINELQTFLGFANFYRRFIYKFSIITAPLTELLKGYETKKGKNNAPVQLNENCKHAILQLKECFYRSTVKRTDLALQSPQ